ncbi:MAG: MogA/MoaB family molybdenum cofactor biosynthesis protein [Actinomycetota bacterium]
MRVAILTVSDKGSVGQREDTSGAYIKATLETQGAEIVDYEIVADDFEAIRAKLIIYSDIKRVDLILTTGGTGLSPRDVTPEATLDIINRSAPGFAEALRAASLKITPQAMLSRAVSGQRDKTIIINLPGSLKAVQEHLEVLLPVLPHALEMAQGQGHGD